MRGIAVFASVVALAGCAAQKVVLPKAETVGMPEKKAEVAAASSAEKKAAGAVLARVGGEVITDRMLDEKINAMPQRMGRFQSPNMKKDMLNSLVELEVVYRQAAREGMDKDKETLAMVEDYGKRVAATRLRERFLKNVKVSDAEVKSEYENQGDRYKTPRQVKVSQILFTWDKNASEKDIEAVKKDAAGILDRAKKGEDFAALAKKYSLDQASAAKGGDIGFANRRQLPPEAYGIAMAFAKEGEISGLVTGREDVRILKATEVIPEKKKPYEEVKQWLERSAQGKKQREEWARFVDELKKKDRVVIFEEKIEQVTAKDAPPGLPGNIKLSPQGGMPPGGAGPKTIEMINPKAGRSGMKAMPVAPPAGGGEN